MKVVCEEIWQKLHNSVGESRQPWAIFEFPFFWASRQLRIKKHIKKHRSIILWLYCNFFFVWFVRKIYVSGKVPCLGPPLPGATPCLGPPFFFLNEKKINIFRLLHIDLFLKVTYWIQICWKKSYFILFFLKIYFFDEKSKFLDVRFYWNIKVKHRWFIYEWKLK